MGLAAKRFEKDYSDNRIPTAMKDMEQRTNGATKKVEVVFDWKSFGDDQGAMDGAWSCWEQSLQGVMGVCEDEIGQEAVKKGLKKIMIVNFAEKKDAEVTFKNGTLTFAMYFKDGTGSSPGWTEVKKVLEAGLD